MFMLGGANVAHAQDEFELDINSASVATIRRSIAERFDTLRDYFKSGAIGFTYDGQIAWRDIGALTQELRPKLESLINDDNKDRSTLYREIARLNGRPDWESNLRYTFGNRWISRAPRGWYYLESGGKWVRKE